MPYFAVDDGAHANLKFRRASMAARGLWVTVGSWVSDQLTDGHVPGDVVRMYGGTPAQVRSLVAVGMWHVHGHECPRCPQPPGAGDYYMHDYTENGNSSRAEIKARREQSVKSSQRHRERQAPKAPPTRGEQLGLDDADQPAPPRRSTIPQGWRPTADDIRAAQTARVDAGLQPLTNDQLRSTTAKFINRQLDDGRLAVAWGGRWQEWAENERTAPPPMPGSNVVPLARAAGASTADQRAAAAYQLAARLEEQED
ncbi:hypothetical protein [Streptomyces zaomyceticus]|uniref:hypothetical protein n=1 Tax=Streptomyces zaomyceticus TaxID=68286 RepID=UPI002E1168E8|nr:hypothetical protein OG237_15750 [Streptomyces zaomyceticus]